MTLPKGLLSVDPSWGCGAP